MTTKFKFGVPVLFEGLNRADCRDVCTFWDDFLASSLSTTADVARWKSTFFTDGAVTLLDGADASQELAGGIIALEVGGSLSDASQAMVNGRSFQIAVGHELYFEARWTNTDLDVSTFVGLSDVGQAEMSATANAAIADLDNGMGFLTVQTALKTHVAKSTKRTDTISGITIATLTWNRAAIHFDGIDTIKFYFAQDDDEMVEVNSLSLTTTSTDYVPDDIMLTPTLEAESQTGANGGSMYVDYILVQQARQRIPD